MIAFRSRHVAGTVGSAAWMVSGRGFGFVWRLVVIGHLGIGDFGLFAIAIAAAALVMTPLEAYYVVRVARVDDASFAVDRASRWWLGLAVMVVGLAMFHWWFVPGLILAKAGADIAFNAYRSTSIRAGDPSWSYAVEAARQLVALAAGSIVLFTAGATLERASLAYLLALVPFALLAAGSSRGVRPRLPHRERRTGSMIVEALGAAAYTQGDIVLLGVLVSSAQAGYFSLGSLVVWTVALVAQNFSITFHEELRSTQGHVSSGPRLRHTLGLAAASGLATLLTGVVLLVADAPRGLWLTFMILSVVAFTRVVSSVFTTVLAVQAADHLRMRITVTAVVVKAAVLVALTSQGAVGAAIAFVLGDLVMVAWAYRALYRSPGTARA